MNKSGMVFGILALALGLMGCGMDQRQAKKIDADHEENEVKVAIDQVPAPVRATLDSEAPGVAIKDVDKESDEGKAVYEADAMIGTQNYEIKIAEDGKLLSKKIDNEAEENGEKAEKGEKQGEKKEEEGEHEDKK